MAMEKDILHSTECLANVLLETIQQATWPSDVHAEKCEFQLTLFDAMRIAKTIEAMLTVVSLRIR